jgi:hypothetical protein
MFEKINTSAFHRVANLAIAINTTVIATTETHTTNKIFFVLFVIISLLIYCAPDVAAAKKGTTPGAYINPNASINVGPERMYAWT